MLPPENITKIEADLKRQREAAVRWFRTASQTDQLLVLNEVTSSEDNPIKVTAKLLAKIGFDYCLLLAEKEPQI